MASLSKLLSQGLREAKCSQVFHSGQTCTEFQFGTSAYSLVKCMKYFLPIVAVPLLSKGRNIRKKHVRDAVEYYIELIVTGFLIAQSVPIAMCGVRGLYGEFTKCNFMYIPMTLPTWPMLFASAKVARLFAASIFQVTFEAGLRNGKNQISRTLCESKLTQAVFFMTCSAFVLQAVQAYGIKAYWIIKSIPVSSESLNGKCTHDGPCSRFCLNDLAKNLLIGISVDLVKTLIGSIPKGKSFFSDLGRKILSLDFPTTLFLSSYSCIYKITSCLLNRTGSSNQQAKHITAAFFGGMSYFFMPKLTILCYAISVSIEISWKLFERRKFEKNLKFIEILRRIPFHRIYICLSAGYLVHMYIFRPEVLSPMGSAIVSAFTGDRAPIVRAEIHKYLRSLMQ